MSEVGRAHRVRYGSIRSILVATRSLLRGVPFFFRATPRTPLRVLGIVALDTLHALRTSRSLPRERARALALFLDFQGCANAAWDHKHLCQRDYETIRERLEHAGLGVLIDAYLHRLRVLESERPDIGGDRARFADVRAYREGVARLVFDTAAAIAIDAREGDEDVETLARILVQCQIIDDVLDYRDDLAGGLPSFLTACASLPDALELTGRAARSYGARDRYSGAAVYPLRVALALSTATTMSVVRLAQWRYRGQPALKWGSA